MTLYHHPNLLLRDTLKMSLLVFGVLCIHACQSSGSHATSEEAVSRESLPSPAQAQEGGADRAYQVTLQKIFGERPVTTLYLTHDTLAVGGVRLPYPSPLRGEGADEDWRSDPSTSSPYVVSFEQLIEAVGPDTIDPDEQMVMRIGPGVTYDQFAWTLYALANQRYDISHILVETTANHYDVIPFIAPRLSPKAQLTPFITVHDVEGCERHTLIQLGSLHDELLSCVEQHGAGESLVVKLQSSPSSPGMTHTYRQDSESSSMLELCTSAHFDALEFAQPPSRACRPWLRLGWNQGQNSIKALTVMLREQAIDLTFNGADILRCDEEPSPHPLCPTPARQARASALLEAWREAIKKDDLAGARDALAELKALKNVKGASDWFHGYYFDHRPEGEYPSPIQPLVMAPASYPMVLIFHELNQLYHDADTSWWTEERRTANLLKPPIWAIAP